MRKWIAFIAFLAVLLGGAVWFTLTYDPTVEEDLPDVVDMAEEMGTRSVTLYFCGSDAQGFVSETRSVAASVHRDTEVEMVLAELLKGPTQGRGVNAFPRGTELRRAFYDERERLLYLDFNDALVANLNPGSAVELALLGSLLRTVAMDFPEIDRVQILVDGLEIETLGGHVDLTRPLRAGEWL